MSISEWWGGFLWGAGAMAVIEVLAALAVWILLRRQDREALRKLESRMFEQPPRGPAGPGLFI